MPSRLLYKSMLDQPIAMWENAYPPRFFCFIDNQYLLEKPKAALELITRFIGLHSFNWGAHTVEYKNNSHGANPVIGASTIPILYTSSACDVVPV
jgi:hypothetical protein